MNKTAPPLLRVRPAALGDELHINTCPCPRPSAPRFQHQLRQLQVRRALLYTPGSLFGALVTHYRNEAPGGDRITVADCTAGVPRLPEEWTPQRCVAHARDTAKELLSGFRRDANTESQESELGDGLPSPYPLFRAIRDSHLAHLHTRLLTDDDTPPGDRILDAAEVASRMVLLSLARYETPTHPMEHAYAEARRHAEQQFLAEVQIALADWRACRALGMLP